MRRVNHGVARLVAREVAGATTLTSVSHRQPARLLPIDSEPTRAAGAALCSLGSFGGGILSGDHIDLEVECKARATLCVNTLASTNVYRKRSSVGGACKAEGDQLSRQTVLARVERDALLVVAPDPVVPFASSSFKQSQDFNIQKGGSLVSVDWSTSGRYMNGERWEFDRYTSRTRVFVGSPNEDLEMQMQGMPTIVDALDLERTQAETDGKHRGNGFGFDFGHDIQINSIASIVIVGPRAVPHLRASFEHAADALCAKQTRIRKRRPKKGYMETGVQTRHEVHSLTPIPEMARRVIVGVSDIPNDSGDDALLVRIAAETNDDVFRLLHHTLSPLSKSLGFTPYNDRIHTLSPVSHDVASNPGVRQSPKPKQLGRGPSYMLSESLDETRTALKVDSMEDENMWFLMMLADSALPTGGFSHSSGLEVAAQLNLLSEAGSRSDVADLETLEQFITSATRSAARFSLPFVRAGHVVHANWMADKSFGQALEAWKRLDESCHALTVGNAPACRASIEQGCGLLRAISPAALTIKQDLDASIVARGALLSYLRDSFSQPGDLASKETGKRHSWVPKGHLPPVFGIVGASFGLSVGATASALGFCVARDIVSAAIRLNLIGPMTSVPLLARARLSDQEGQRAAKLRINSEARVGDNDGSNVDAGLLDCAGSSAPVIEALHPCHESLAMRLFQT